MSDNDYDEGYRAGMQKMRDLASNRIEELIEEGSVMAQKLDAAEAKLAKAVRLMELSIELATWNNSLLLLDDVILFTTEMKEPEA